MDAVANKCHYLSFDATQLFSDSHQVGNYLTWMREVSQRIDGWDHAVCGKIKDILMSIGSDDCTMHHAAQHTSSVLDGLSPPQLHVISSKENNLTT